MSSGGSGSSVFPSVCPSATYVAATVLWSTSTSSAAIISGQPEWFFGLEISGRKTPASVWCMFSSSFGERSPTITDAAMFFALICPGSALSIHIIFFFWLAGAVV